MKRKELLLLYKKAGWWRNGYSSRPATLDAMVRGSFCFAGAFDKGRMIGMGRCVSDGASDAYIHDVTVLPRYRRSGVGARIVGKLVEYLHAHKIEWIGLVAERGAKRFYEELGFKAGKGWIPMVWER